MEHNIPVWITADFLKQSLDSDDRYRGIEIIDFKASLAAPAGNNYGSLVIRVTMDYKLKGDERKMSVIVKGPITEGITGQFLTQMKNSEPSFYNIFLPEANRLSKVHFAADTFHSPISSVVVIVDLKESGYLMADRVKQLDFEHCLLYTNAAAAFHATSIALCKQNPEIIDVVRGENVYSDECKAEGVLRSMYTWGVECMAKHITDKKISKIVKDSAKHIWGFLKELHRPSGDLNCLIQGDPWTTNMMFKYDSRGKVCDIKLLDFQDLLYSSPVHDLVFFIWSSANVDVRKHHLRNLYSNYVTELNSNLRTFKCPEVNLENFMDTVKMFSPIALVTAAISALILNNTPVDFDEIFAKGSSPVDGDDTNPMERYYTEHFCQTVLPQMVDHLAAEGVFDYLEEKIKALSDHVS